MGTSALEEAPQLVEGFYKPGMEERLISPLPGLEQEGRLGSAAAACREVLGSRLARGSLSDQHQGEAMLACGRP